MGIGINQVSYGRGSGPFAGQNEKHKLTDRSQNSIGELVSDVEEFGWYNSKGFNVNLEGIRPIDIQFVFNRGIEGWKHEQESLTEDPTKSNRNISPKFFYSVLHEPSK